MVADLSVSMTIGFLSLLSVGYVHTPVDTTTRVTKRVSQIDGLIAIVWYTYQNVFLGLYDYLDIGIFTIHYSYFLC